MFSRSSPVEDQFKRCQQCDWRCLEHRKQVPEARASIIERLEHRRQGPDPASSTVDLHPSCRISWYGFIIGIIAKLIHISYDCLTEVQTFSHIYRLVFHLWSSGSQHGGELKRGGGSSVDDFGIVMFNRAEWRRAGRRRRRRVSRSLADRSLLERRPEGEEE